MFIAAAWTAVYEYEMCTHAHNTRHLRPGATPISGKNRLVPTTKPLPARDQQLFDAVYRIECLNDNEPKTWQVSLRSTHFERSAPLQNARMPSTKTKYAETKRE